MIYSIDLASKHTNFSNTSYTAMNQTLNTITGKSTLHTFMLVWLSYFQKKPESETETDQKVEKNERFIECQERFYHNYITKCSQNEFE